MHLDVSELSLLYSTVSIRERDNETIKEASIGTMNQQHLKKKKRELNEVGLSDSNPQVLLPMRRTRTSPQPPIRVQVLKHHKKGERASLRLRQDY